MSWFLWCLALHKIDLQKCLPIRRACHSNLWNVSNGLGQREDNGDTKDFFLFVGCFSSKRSTGAAKYIGADFLGTVKTSTKGFCKDTINNLIKYWPGGSYLVFSIKPTVPGDR